MADDEAKRDPNPRPQCDHICLEPDGHDGPHFHGYRFPSPAREIERLQAEIERLRQEVDLKGSRLDDALDEIERLRSRIVALEDAGTDLANILVGGSALAWDMAIDVWEEARRG